MRSEWHGGAVVIAFILQQEGPWSLSQSKRGIDSKLVPLVPRVGPCLAPEGLG